MEVRKERRFTTIVMKEEDKDHDARDDAQNYLTSLLLLGDLHPVISEAISRPVVQGQERRHLQEVFKSLPPRPRIPLKLLVTVGTTFRKEGRLYRITRVTDRVFDSIDTVTGQVRVRNLGLWDNAEFTRTVSQVRGLLTMQFGGREGRGRGREARV